MRCAPARIPDLIGEVVGGHENGGKDLEGDEVGHGVDEPLLPHLHNTKSQIKTVSDKKNSCFFPYRIRKLYGKYFLKLNSWRKKHSKSIIYTSQAFVLFLIRFFLL